jgi:AraC family transcriptional regulator of adaptative response / DNA-3-methyladenine glycosylase II
MRIDSDICYEAMSSRDARFDGRFFTAVRTTGIYCRPICPARTPHRKNVTFHPSAASAEREGYRPCRRCRPDASPGSPEWHGTSGIVSRGLRMIHSGRLDQDNVPALADRLGVGERHLTRLFLEHIGTTPGAIARTRRVHFARKLIDETDLSMADVAVSAGFSSIRRFNAAVKASFGGSPTELRAKPGQSRRSSAAPLQLQLAYRPPYDWAAMLSYLAGRAIPGVEAVHGDAYRRSVSGPDGPGVIEITPAPRANALLLRAWLPNSKRLLHVVERVRQQFDLLADPSVIEAHLGRDALLGPILRRHPGLRVPGAWDGYELAVRAILGQQVSVKGATTIAGRLVERAGRPLPKELRREGLEMVFPDPESLARADLDKIGMPGARVRAVVALAHGVAEGRLRLDPETDPDEARRRLCALPGVGEWTADYVAMRALRQPDAFPKGDLGLRKAAAPEGETVTANALEARAVTWRPWRSYAALLLWNH